NSRIRLLQTLIIIIIMSSNAITKISLLLFYVSLLPSISPLNQEGLSLLSWLSTFSSSSSSFFSSWKNTTTQETPCQWDYIKCNRNGFVSEITITSINLGTAFPSQLLSFKFLTTLVLSNSNLTGEIPTSIGNLSSLMILDLSFNALTGRIPQEIGKLSELWLLSLSSNSLEGVIPPEIGNCSRLQQIQLFDNLLSGRIPAEIGNLWDLKIFRAGGNLGIRGEIPMQISKCRELVFLGIADTGISGQIPHSLGDLKKLQTLSAYTANLTGKIPPEIGNCSVLENLFVYGNQISGEIPGELGLLKSLKKLLLWQNKLTGKIPATLGNCSGLTVIDFSLNSLTGEIPQSLAKLTLLEELLLSENNISGKIPSFIGNFSNLRQLILDNNRVSGEIPPAIGELKELSMFFAWQNQLHGSIPDLSNCKKLQGLDLSHNFLTGSVPKSLFNISNLTELLLISNELSGDIPATIGNCTGLTRLRLGCNMLSGQVPGEIGLLQKLSFLELEIPTEIGNCTQLQLIDLHGNNLQGKLPTSFEFLIELNVLDLSVNRISGVIPQNMGKLKSLNKLVLSRNNFGGFIPQSLGLCKDLQLLDLSNNRISGLIPDEIGHLQELDNLLNLSWNSLRGPVPESFSSLSKLANLDLSHNSLTGGLGVLGNLDNLASLNVSYNNFSGSLPNTKLFQDLPATAFTVMKSSASIVATMWAVMCIAGTIIIVSIGMIFLIRARGSMGSDGEDNLGWEITLFQKLNFSMDDIVAKLMDSNIVGKGGSGVVYRVETSTQQVIAVKKLWPTKNGDFPERDFFSAEITTLGSIRHRNIVRLLGCCKNGETRLLLFDFISNGSLARLLHEKKVFLNWDARYKIILGAAHGLAYLHHDCIPPIVHRDIKANNILVGSQHEAFLADFGLAKLVNSSECSGVSNTVAENGYSLRITEKSDVYSYGIVLLEVLTGMEPTDCRIPEGAHIVSWVNQELRVKRAEFTSILDQQLLHRSGHRAKRWFSPEERPTMKDVVAMLREIRQENEDCFEKPNSIGEWLEANSQSAAEAAVRVQVSLDHPNP
ncbi:unnamed protein product, partial [Thlaspi arvense]